MNEFVVDSVPESKRSPEIKKIAQRNEPPHPEMINQETEHTEQNETEHIKICRINTRTELLM